MANRIITRASPAKPKVARASDRDGCDPLSVAETFGDAFANLWEVVRAGVAVAWVAGVWDADCVVWDCWGAEDVPELLWPCDGELPLELDDDDPEELPPDDPPPPLGLGVGVGVWCGVEVGVGVGFGVGDGVGGGGGVPLVTV